MAVVKGLNRAVGTTERTLLYNIEGLKIAATGFLSLYRAGASSHQGVRGDKKTLELVRKARIRIEILVVGWFLPLLLHFLQMVGNQSLCLGFSLQFCHLLFIYPLL